MPGTLEETASSITRLISICRDAEQGFRSVAGVTREPELRDLFTRYADMHGRFAGTLQEGVRALGYEPDAPAGLGGVLYGGWVNLKALVTSHNQHGLLVEAERGEDWVVSAYRAAVDTNLPVGLRPIITQQMEEVEKAHTHLEQRRDATAPKEENAAH